MQFLPHFCVPQRAIYTPAPRIVSLCVCVFVSFGNAAIFISCWNFALNANILQIINDPSRLCQRPLFVTSTLVAFCWSAVSAIFKCQNSSTYQWRDVHIYYFFSKFLCFFFQSDNNLFIECQCKFEDAQTCVYMYVCLTYIYFSNLFPTTKGFFKGILFKNLIKIIYYFKMKCTLINGDLFWKILNFLPSSGRFPGKPSKKGVWH